jgi:predicted DCC family thiol-disulfide oxidoreductase YuxK
LYTAIYNHLNKLLVTQVPAIGIGVFRVCYGLITLQEIIFLLYFNHLIFDPIPYLDIEFPLIPFFLCLWGINTICLTSGYRSQFSSYANYLFWIVFVNFTPMQRDFDGGFDTFMIGAGFFLLFMPIDRRFSIDSLRIKLSHITFSILQPSAAKVSILTYHIPIAICLGFLYFDSAIHKLFAEHWRNGLGAWLPSTMPYYVSALDMSWLLNIEPLQKSIGYTIFVFQFLFVFVFYQRHLRPIMLLIGAGLHLGITISLNIYPFGLGMLAFYALLIPFSWWRYLEKLVTFKHPQLFVFYDEQCPLCNRTAIIINHFDICKAIKFKGLQNHSSKFHVLRGIDNNTLLNDLYATTNDQTLFNGLDTYIQILYKMRYPALFGLILKIPGIYHLAKLIYRNIADNRIRLDCDEFCLTQKPLPENFPTLYTQLFENFACNHPKKFSRKLSKILIVLLCLQINSSIHYGIFYRFDVDLKKNNLTKNITAASNNILLFSQTFLGITPHALYLHDHFEGYHDILAITYKDKHGIEKWLPFVNAEGRMIAPNWGRVHSMWANIAVTPDINQERLKKFIMKVTAFWGIRLNLDLNETEFIIKHKTILSPTVWIKDLRKKNLSGEWENIGSAKWKNRIITIILPKVIESTIE